MRSATELTAPRLVLIMAREPLICQKSFGFPLNNIRIATMPVDFELTIYSRSPSPLSFKRPLEFFIEVGVTAY